MSTIIHEAVARLKRTQAYNRLRISTLHDIYLTLKDRNLGKEKDRQAEFYLRLLSGFQSNDLVFAIGANVGDRVEIFTKIGARVVAVEPDEESQETLRQRFLNYRFKPKPVTIVGKAVGSNAGIQSMFVSSPGSVFNTLSRKSVDFLTQARRQSQSSKERLQYAAMRAVEITTLENLIDSFGVPKLIKIDVVGFELEVLQGLHRPVPFLSFEIELPELRTELLQCVELLRKLSNQGQFNYTWDRREGLILDHWLDAREFLPVLEDLRVGPLEVFWRNPSL